MSLETEDKIAVKGGFKVTPQQERIIDHVAMNPFTAVAAGAGAGKTRTSIATVMHLIEEKNASIDQFVLISFTNKAANSLRSKIQQALNDRVLEANSTQEHFKWLQQQERLSAAFVGTIHGFCRELLKRYGYLDGVAVDAGITFTSRLRKDAFMEVITEHLSDSKSVKLYSGESQIADYELLKLMSAIHDHIGSQGLKFEDVLLWTQHQMEDEGKPYRVALANLVLAGVKAYNQVKQKNQVLDVHDLLQKTADLFANPEVKDLVTKQLARRYNYLFVDEFQDTDVVQMRIVEALIPELSGVLVVGDQKQSIYSFRGTQSHLLEELSQRYAKCAPLPMNVSYRPTNRFRKLVNVLFDNIGNDPLYKFLKEPLEAHDDIFEGKQDPPPMIFLECNEHEGIDGRIKKTANAIKRLLSGKLTLEYEKDSHNSVRQGDIVVLARSNYVVQLYAEGLRNELAGTSFSVVADIGDEFYSLPEIVSVYFMLQLLLGYPYDDSALTLTFNSPYMRSIDQKEIIDEQFRQIHLPAKGYPISQSFRDYYKDLHEKILSLQKSMRTATVPQLLEELYRLFFIREYYYAEANEQAIQNIELLRNIARDFFQEDQALTLHSFVDFMRSSTLTGRTEERVELPEEKDASGRLIAYRAIRVMTIHAAKGLEFPIVIIPEVNEKLRKAYEAVSPSFLVITKDKKGNVINHGLEAKLKITKSDGGLLETRSVAYWRALGLDEERLLQEEMRVLYVGVTRARNVVVFVGEKRGGQKCLDKSSPNYSWQDEIYRNASLLISHGGVFG